MENKDYKKLYLKYKKKYSDLKKNKMNGGSISKDNKKNSERKDSERKDSERIDSERIDSERKDSERIDSERKDSERIDLMLFKAEWCGHCQNFKPVWEKMEKKYNKKYNFLTYDSDKDDNMMKNWGVMGFPTIIAKKKNLASEYRGSREEKDILKFLKDFEKMN